MRVLVTGGAGFIGGHLVRRLLEEHEVVSLDIRRHSIEGAECIEGDVRSKSDVAKMMRACEAVFHLAAIASIGEGDFYGVNHLGSRNVFGEAERRGLKAVYTSSASVYGNAKPPVSECSRCAPLSDYGRSKLLAEAEAPAGSFIARLFNVYGPGGRSVINRFCGQAIIGEPFTIIDPAMTRDYVYVDDVVKALLVGLGMEGIHNVGTGTPTSTMDIASLVAKKCKVPLRTVSIPPRDNEIIHSSSSIKSMSSLGWRPSVPLEDGIGKVLVHG